MTPRRLAALTLQCLGSAFGVEVIGCGSRVYVTWRRPAITANDNARPRRARRRRAG